MRHCLCGFSLVIIFLAGFFLLAVSACSSNSEKWDPEDYTVKSGDTIYSIAWRYELDPEALVAWNNIKSSHFIKPGQRLHTRKPYNYHATKRVAQAADVAYAPGASTKPYKSPSALIAADQRSVKARKGDTLYGLSKRSGVAIDRLAQLNQLKNPYTIKPGQTIFLKPLKTPTGKSKPVQTGSKHKNKITASGKVKPEPTKLSSRSQTLTSKIFSWPKAVRWRRPAKGNVIKKFSRQRNDSKGIDIAGRAGDAIVASAPGKVVYSGNGLISYGNLIIIKHNKTYLSAYAYNRKLLVEEGDIIKSGQKIAEMGRKDKLSPRLHFEIRKNGKPVDPLKYLPW